MSLFNLEYKFKSRGNFIKNRFKNKDMKKYDYVIVGAGIAGCSTAYFLSKYSNSILLIDKNSDVAYGASGAAGAFLSPLLGKPNGLKDIVNEALKFSTIFYKENFPDEIINCGTCRIPKTKEDKEKFESYEDFMEFTYEKFQQGYFFPIGSVVNSYNICKTLSLEVKKLLNYEVKKLFQQNSNWILNDEIETQNLILTTGANIDLICEDYFNIRAVWGEKIDISSSTNIDINYHKACSISKSKSIKNQEKNFISLGATHHRFKENMSNTSFDLNKKDINKIEHNQKSLDIINSDIDELLTLACEIKTLKDVEVLDIKIGARASSVDYYPIIGKLVNSKKSIEKHPHIVNGSFIKEDSLVYYENLFVLNAVGGRGYVLSPFLANSLVEFIINNKPLNKDIMTYRLFKRWARRLKSRGYKK
ncbi:MAG: FAD-dependent oxidoreductase [Campylobacterota bacterium]